MRILIVTHPRSGGRSLTKWIAYELGCEFIHEPYHTVYTHMEDLNKMYQSKDIVVKILYHDIDDIMNIDNFINSFDKIICLTRKNTFNAAISLTKAQESEKWHDNYEINSEWITNNIVNIKKNHSDINHAEGKIIEFPYFQVTYENIYEKTGDIKELKNFLGIKRLKGVKKFLDNKLRYKK
jgi:hypothetical protein